MIKFCNLFNRTLAIGFFGLASTNFANALYAYQSGTDGQRKGFLGPNTNTFVVWASATLGLMASVSCVVFAFK